MNKHGVGFCTQHLLLLLLFPFLMGTAKPVLFLTMEETKAEILPDSAMHRRSLPGVGVYNGRMFYVCRTCARQCSVVDLIADHDTKEQFGECTKHDPHGKWKFIGFQTKAELPVDLLGARPAMPAH